MSDIDAPADPKATVSYRTAKAIVIVLSALIILALIGLVVAVIYKVNMRSNPVTGSASAFVLPPGASVVSMETQPGRVILHLHGPQGDEIDILSTDDGHLVAQIKSAPPDVPVR